MKKVAFLLAVFFIMGCNQKPNFQRLIDVNVIVMDDSKNEICSGTIISKGIVSIRVLSAAHCILQEDNTPREVSYIKVSQLEIYKAKVLKYDAFLDLSILESVEPVFGFLPVAQLGTHRELGQEIWSVGMPGGVEDVVSKGILSKLDTINWAGGPSDLVDVAIFFGSSGGSIFNSSGEVLGVVVELGPQASVGPVVAWGYVVDINTVRGFLKGLI